MSIYRIFKELPPDDLILKFFSIVGIDSFTNASWFPKSIFNDTTSKQFNDLMNDLEPYYQDHKLFIVHRDMNANRYIQILRHLAKSKGIYLESKAYGKQKGTYYRLHVVSNKKAEFFITFD
jgi:hypothetical protein